MVIVFFCYFDVLEFGFENDRDFIFCLMKFSIERIEGGKKL